MVLLVSRDHGIWKKEKPLWNDFCRYARENLALVNVYIKDPSVTQVVRDQKVPVIWFVANIGGILGWKTFQSISYKI